MTKARRKPTTNQAAHSHQAIFSTAWIASRYGEPLATRGRYGTMSASNQGQRQDPQKYDPNDRPSQRRTTKQHMRGRHPHHDQAKDDRQRIASYCLDHRSPKVSLARQLVEIKYKTASRRCGWFRAAAVASKGSAKKPHHMRIVVRQGDGNTGIAGRIVRSHGIPRQPGRFRAAAVLTPRAIIEIGMQLDRAGAFACRFLSSRLFWQTSCDAEFVRETDSDNSPSY